MAKEKQVKDQLDIVDFSADIQKYVCQSNELVQGKQGLKLNSTKLVRAAIMQVAKEDEELHPYVITIGELADLLQISKSNVYRDINAITDDIISHPVFVRKQNGDKIQWVKIPWVQKCEYNSDTGLLLQLNVELAPYLVKLKERYTQYTLQEIVSFKSVYSIRLYELLKSKIMSSSIPGKGIDVQLSLEAIRECCGCEGKVYDHFSHLRTRVIEPAVEEINQKTWCNLSYSLRKDGRSVCGIVFHITEKGRKSDKE